MILTFPHLTRSQNHCQMQTRFQNHWLIQIHSQNQIQIHSQNQIQIHSQNQIHYSLPKEDLCKRRVQKKYRDSVEKLYAPFLVRLRRLIGTSLTGRCFWRTAFTFFIFASRLRTGSGRRGGATTWLGSAFRTTSRPWLAAFWRGARSRGILAGIVLAATRRFIVRRIVASIASHGWWLLDCVCWSKRCVSQWELCQMKQGEPLAAESTK